jgi:septum formation protein
LEPSGLRERGEAVRTAVLFRDLSVAEIAAYVATGEPLDKAGAYAIQGGAAGMVREFQGSYTNVVGLPMEALSRILSGWGVEGEGNR